MAELALEHAAELAERRPGVVEPLEDEGRACLEFGEHPSHVGGAAERLWPPRDALRVGADLELLFRLDEAEAGVPQASRAQKPLDVCD
jgi:hypothetical protein